jgi:hypothetical protein
VKTLYPRAIRTLLGAALLIATTSFAAAHTLQTNTARITLRDEHLDIVAELDLFAVATSSSTELATATDQDVGTAAA